MLRERRHRRAVWSWAIAATVFFLLAGVGSVYLTYELDHERRVTLRLLVAKAERAVQDKNYPLALGLSLQAWDMGPAAESSYGQRAYQVMRETLAANQNLIRIFQQHGAVRAIAVNAKDSLVVTGSTDQTARLWNARTGRSIGQPMLTMAL